MDSSKEGSTAAPAPKRRRFTREPDLVVEVEEKTYRLDARVLMAASDVFAAMLESDMSEAQDGHIKLDGKKHSEFELLLQHLDLRGGAAPPEIDEESLDVLLRWADEYDIAGLKGRCKKFLDTQLRHHDERRAMALSLEFGFTDIAKKFAESMARDLFESRDIITEFADHPVMMNEIATALQRKFGLEPRGDGEEVSITKTLWLILSKMLERERGWPGKTVREYYFMRARDLEKKIMSIVPAFPRGIFEIRFKEGDFDKMVSFDHVKNKCSGSHTSGMRFDGGEVAALLATLLEKGKVFKSETSGKYYRGQGDSDSE